MNHAARLTIALNKSLSLDQRKRFLESILSSTDCPRAIYQQAESAYHEVREQLRNVKDESDQIAKETREHIKKREGR